MGDTESPVGPYAFQLHEIQVVVADFAVALDTVAHKLTQAVLEWPTILEKADSILSRASATVPDEKEVPKMINIDWFGVLILGTLFFSLGALAVALLTVACQGCRRKAHHTEEDGRVGRKIFIPVFIPVVRGSGTGLGQGRSLVGPSVDVQAMYRPDLQVRCLKPSC